jgi:hypothetical protein
MSAKSIEKILTRAMNDAEFAAQMLINPKDALAEYDLTNDELERFESLSKANFDAFSKATPMNIRVKG